MTEQERAAWITEQCRGYWWAVTGVVDAYDQLTDAERATHARAISAIIGRVTDPLTDALEQVRAYLVDGDVGEARALIERTLAREG